MGEIELLPFPGLNDNSVSSRCISHNSGYTMVPTWLLIWLVLIFSIIVLIVLYRYLFSDRT